MPSKGSNVLTTPAGQVWFWKDNRWLTSLLPSNGIFRRCLLQAAVPGAGIFRRCLQQAAVAGDVIFRRLLILSYAHIYI